MAYSRDELINYLYQVADSYGIDRKIAFRQIQQESGFNPNARSGAGAEGIAQFIPGTAKRFGLKDPYDPIASLNAYGAYMSVLLEMFGYRYDIALAAYNSGENRQEYTNAYNEGRPINWQILPARVQDETRNYVKKILGYSDRPIYSSGETEEPSNTQPDSDGFTIYSFESEEKDKEDSSKNSFLLIGIAGLGLLLLVIIAGGSSSR